MQYACTQSYAHLYKMAMQCLFVLLMPNRTAEIVFELPVSDTVHRVNQLKAIGPYV